MNSQTDMLDLLPAKERVQPDAPFPTPWIVGPYGAIWVAADVEFKNGKWHPTCDEPRIVMMTGEKEQGLAAFIVLAVNAYALSSQMHETQQEE